jgi:hypothetical protein
MIPIQFAGAALPPIEEATPDPQNESLIASTITVAADPAAASEGGEWQLLVEKFNGWLGEVKAAELWQQSQRPLKLVGAGLGLLLLLQLSGAVLGSLEHLPMVPRLLQLSGLVWLGSFSSRRLLRSQERRQLIQTVWSAWNAFSGRGGAD